jgi:hypothetical protein
MEVSDWFGLPCCFISGITYATFAFHHFTLHHYTTVLPSPISMSYHLPSTIYICNTNIYLPPFTANLPQLMSCISFSSMICVLTRWMGASVAFIHISEKLSLYLLRQYSNNVLGLSRTNISNTGPLRGTSRPNHHQLHRRRWRPACRTMHSESQKLKQCVMCGVVCNWKYICRLICIYATYSHDGHRCNYDRDRHRLWIRFKD